MVILKDLDQEKKYLVFNIGLEKFALEADRVKEIALCHEAVAMPGQPCVIEGAINLRGVIIPVLNLRKSFSLPAAFITDKTRIIILDTGEKRLGIIVDHVLEEITIPEDIIAVSKDHFSLCLQQKYIGKVAKLESGEVCLLNLQEIVKEL